MVPTECLTIRQPDDWHLHLRDGDLTRLVLPYTARKFGRALVMPNIVPPVVTATQAEDYKKRILEHLPTDSTFEPLMTLYLTDDTDPADVRSGIQDGVVSAVKLYPAGATTNSHSGVTDWRKIERVLDVLGDCKTPLCVHGEVTAPHIDIFDREAVFIDSVLIPIRQGYPTLKIILEHITTSQAVDYVLSDGPFTAATITVHHLMINRNHLFRGGIRPHYYCLPIAKRECHRQRLLDIVKSGQARFFLGTDSAPHTKGAKESDCGCAGIFTAPLAMECLVQVFDDLQILDRLENFTSVYGAEFYGLPLNERFVRLSKSETPLTLPSRVQNASTEVIIFNPEIPVHWTTEDMCDE